VTLNPKCASADTGVLVACWNYCMLSFENLPKRNSGNIWLPDEQILVWFFFQSASSDAGRD